MKPKILLLVFAAVALQISETSTVFEFGKWLMYKTQFKKFYQSPSEELYRSRVWMNNLRIIAEHNKLFENGNSSFEMGLNEFSDMTTEEFLDAYTMKIHRKPEEFYFDEAPEENVDYELLAETQDWRRSGAVTEVKNQGRCGSCFAFSATGAIEGQMKLKHGQIAPLSEQQIIDCSKPYGNHGCHGGDQSVSFKYIKAQGGIETEKAYSYKGIDNEKCSFNKKGVGAHVRGFEWIGRNENSLKSAVANKGPIAVSIEVIGSFHHYRSGVYDDHNCGKKINHAVLAVGYGSEKRKDYWLIKNSWGRSFGIQGYIKMVRNKNNQCGIAIEPVVPIIS